MTSTSFNVGLGESSRNSSKVLKPPGGGSSDIFGSDVEQSPRRIRNTNHLKSSVFGSNGTSEPSSTPRNKLDGNPVTGEGYTAAAAANGEKESSSPPAATNNTTITTTTTNGSGSGSAEARRNRVPPGGYSSGLW